MAGVTNDGPKNGKGRKRGLNFDLNLVPFIDLLSMCICFLLMTAVWLQLSAMKIQQSLGTSAEAAPQSPKYSADVEFLSVKSLVLDVKSPNGKSKREKLQAEDVPGLLKSVLARLSVLQAEKGVDTLLVTPHVDVSYSQLIDFYDGLKGLGIQNFGLVPVRAR